MDGTILSQGTFTSTLAVSPNPGNAVVGAGSAITIAIPSNADWVEVFDYTQKGTAGSSAAYFQGTANGSIGNRYYWQRGMPAGSAMTDYYANTTTTVTGDTITSGGFTLYDPSGQTPGALPLLGNAVATTASTNATRPVVSTASTAGLTVGSIVRMSNTAQTDVNGIDMVVGTIVNNTSFTLLTSTNPLATAPGLIGGAGFYRIVNYNALFYPRVRYVVGITKATNGQVSTSIPHGLTVGQSVRFDIPTVSGMVQLNGTPQNNYMPVIILSVIDDYNFTINIDTSTYSTFTWPTSLPNQLPTSFPIVIPFGEDSATSLSTNAAQVPTIGGQQIFNTNTGLLADSTVNTGFLGMIFGSGGVGTVLTTPITGPAGTVSFTSGNVPTGDVMYWRAGKSSYGGL